MKRYFAALLMLAAMVSCGKQDDVYKEFIVEGGRVYPAKSGIWDPCPGSRE